MRRTLRLAALVLLLAAVGFWAVAGANRGWTKTSVPQKIVDQVTGIEGVRYEKKFVPGVDFLAVAAFGAGLLAGVSFLFRRKKTGKPGQNR